MERRDAEAWFRRRGLPVVVRRRVRGVALLPRATPAIVFFLLIGPLLVLLGYVVAFADDLIGDETTSALVVLGLTLAALVVPPLGGWLVSKGMRRLERRGQLVVVGVVLLVALVVAPILEQRMEITKHWWTAAMFNGGAVLVVLVLTYVGAGSILAWAARVAVSQLGAVGTLASKALPLLMIVILLSFFTNEIWQLVDPEVMERPRLWAVVGFFAALGVLFLWSVVHDEMRALDKQRRGSSAADLRDRLGETPFATLVADDHHGDKHPLSRGERFNIVLVFFFAQAAQVVVFAFLVFCFFVVFGALAIDQSVLESWVDHPVKGDDGRLFRLDLPVPNELIQMSVFLSAFSGLYFAGSAATDPLYRDKFFDPLVRDIRVSLAAREAYLGHWGLAHVHEH